MINSTTLLFDLLTSLNSLPNTTYDNNLLSSYDNSDYYFYSYSVRIALVSGYFLAKEVSCANEPLISLLTSMFN